MRPQHAWLAFGLAVLCICVAVAYAVYQSRRSGGGVTTQPPYQDIPWFTAQEYERLPKVPIPKPTRPPAAPAPKAASPGTPPTAQLVQVYPGGWVWNPAWHDHYYWDHRWGDHRRPRRWREMDKWTREDQHWDEERARHMNRRPDQKA